MGNSPGTQRSLLHLRRTRSPPGPRLNCRPILGTPARTGNATAPAVDTRTRNLEAVGGRPLLERSYDAAVAEGYLWHEFGDVHLILP